MLLTKSAQLKYQSYVIKSVIEQQSLIISLLDEEEPKQAFIGHMIKYDYKQAFKICTSYFSVHGEIKFMQSLLACFYPSVIHDWNEYFILVQNETSDDFEVFDKCLLNECKAFNLIYSAIFE